MSYYLITLVYALVLFARADNAPGGLVLLLLWCGWTVARVVRERLSKTV